MDEPVQEQTLQKKGWPKGKKRGPRKPADAPPSVPELSPEPERPTVPIKPFDPEQDEELVVVSAHLSTGSKLDFRCSAFSCEGRDWEFVSFPHRRGFKTLRIMRADSLADLQITAPEQFFENLRRQAAPAPARLASVPPMPSYSDEGTGTPQIATNPFTKFIKDEKANVSRAVTTQDGTPRAVVTEHTKEGKVRQITVGASMV